MPTNSLNQPGYIYILTNKNNSVLYVGVTNDLKRRVSEHKFDSKPGSFTTRYNINKLVYYETFHWIDEAIAREKQLKAGSRKRKNELIDRMNPEWRDLYEDVCKWEE
jgi:putative endonuclease